MISDKYAREKAYAVTEDAFHGTGQYWRFHIL